MFQYIPKPLGRIVLSFSCPCIFYTFSFFCHKSMEFRACRFHMVLLMTYGVLNVRFSPLFWSQLFPGWAGEMCGWAWTPGPTFYQTCKSVYYSDFHLSVCFLQGWAELPLALSKQNWENTRVFNTHSCFNTPFILPSSHSISDPLRHPVTDTAHLRLCVYLCCVHWLTTTREKEAGKVRGGTTSRATSFDNTTALHTVSISGVQSYAMDIHT